MDISLNGAPHTVPPHTTLLELMTQLDLTAQTLAVAINREVIRRETWADHVLFINDKVDVVRAIGGG